MSVERRLSPEETRAIIDTTPRLKEFVDSGKSKMVSVYTSMAYLLHSVANEYVEESLDIMEEYDLVHKKLKTRSINLSTAFELYNKTVSGMINGHDKAEEAGRELCKDYDVFKETCDRFMLAGVRLKGIEAWNRDDLREDGLYLCEVQGAKDASTLLLRWKGKKWLQYDPAEGWRSLTPASVTEVVERVKEKAV